jgi:predicted  nucleic acid-binding Zn-ribbon protein
MGDELREGTTESIAVVMLKDQIKNLEEQVKNLEDHVKRLSETNMALQETIVRMSMLNVGTMSIQPTRSTES